MNTRNWPMLAGAILLFLSIIGATAALIASGSVPIWLKLDLGLWWAFNIFAFTAALPSGLRGAINGRRRR